MNVDITVYLEGYHGDTSRTFLVGDVVRCYLLSSVSSLILLRMSLDECW